MQDKVAVVILNWNGKGYLEKFLPSVIKYSAGYRIVLADNASTDNSIEFLKSHYPQVEIIQNDFNGGFAKGYNDALKRVSAEYYILLNSDVEVTENWIPPVISLMEDDKKIAACQPKLLSFSDKTKFEYAGAAGGYIDRYGYPFCRGRIFNSIEKDAGQYNDVTEIFWASGACMFIRSNLFHEVKGFDEDFFAHMEEIDLCWRLKNSGYKIMFTPASTVYHLGGGTLNKINPTKTYLNFTNSLTALYKNHPRKGLFFKFLTRLILDGIAGIRFLLTGQIMHCVAIIKAHFSFYKHFKKTSIKRKSLKVQRELSVLKGVYKKGIVLDYYAFGRKKFYDLNKQRLS